MNSNTREDLKAHDCEHDWHEEYYGTRCSKCGVFYPFGSEPWLPDDPALGEVQAIRTYGDDLRDAGKSQLDKDETIV